MNGTDKTLLAQRQIDYAEALRQTKLFFANVHLDLLHGRAHVEIHERGERYRVTVRARAMGETCVDKDEAAEWLANMSYQLERDIPCGTINFVPNGSSTDIIVIR